MDTVTIMYVDEKKSTLHEFQSLFALNAWLEKTLVSMRADENIDLAEVGYSDDGIGLLCYYENEGYDHLGQFDIFIDNIGIYSAFDLAQRAEAWRPVVVGEVIDTILSLKGPYNIIILLATSGCKVFRQVPAMLTMPEIGKKIQVEGNRENLKWQLADLQYCRNRTSHQPN